MDRQSGSGLENELTTTFQESLEENLRIRRPARHLEERDQTFRGNAGRGSGEHLGITVDRLVQPVRIPIYIAHEQQGMVPFNTSIDHSLQQFQGVFVSPAFTVQLDEPDATERIGAVQSIRMLQEGFTFRQVSQMMILDRSFIEHDIRFLVIEHIEVSCQRFLMPSF
jgi:hypothetical protein